MRVTIVEVPTICSSVSRHDPKRHRSFVEDGLVLAVIGRCALLVRIGWAQEEVRLIKVTFTLGNFEGMYEVISKASAFQREEGELAKPFLIWHVTKTSH